MKQCLVIDSSQIIRRVVRHILSEMHFEIFEARDGKEALERCRDRMPDAILLDWNLQSISGIEFLSALRKAEGGNEPKVLFCTTENDVVRIKEALRAGANEYIMKPFDRDILESKFSTVGLV